MKKMKQSIAVLVMLVVGNFGLTSCSSDDDNGMVNAQVIEGFLEVRSAIDGVADFIDGPIGNLTVDLGMATMAEGGFTAAQVDPQTRNMALTAAQTYASNPSNENAIASAEASAELVIANRNAIAENFVQILGDDFPSNQDLGNFIESVQGNISMPENLDPVALSAYNVIVEVQTNGAVVKFLLDAANAKFSLGLDVPEYNAPDVPNTTSAATLINVATASVGAVADLAVPSVTAIQEIVDDLLEVEALEGYENLRAAIDGVADFINGPIATLTEDLGELTMAEGGFSSVMVDQQARTDAITAVETYNENPNAENAIAASMALEALVVANRVAIIGDFEQILGDDFPSNEDLGALIASVEEGLPIPSGLSDVEEAVYNTILAVHINGNAVEALLGIANNKYELGLTIPSYEGPSLPSEANETNLLETGSESVAAVAALAVPSVQAIQEIVDDLLNEN